MKKKIGRSGRRERRGKMKGAVAKHLSVQLGQVSLLAFEHQKFCASAKPYQFQTLLDSEASEAVQPNVLASSSVDIDADVDVNAEDKEFILSQDFFCTPDYITPDGQYMSNSLDCNMDIPCPKSPDKLNTVKNKRLRQDGMSSNSLLPCHDQAVELSEDTSGADEIKIEKAMPSGLQKPNYVSQSAVALRCRVMPPPCIKNPYLEDASETDIDPFGSRRSKCTGFFSEIVGGDGLSRYRSDFHEIEQIGDGNFSRVFKVLKRIDGCMYAVKHSTRQLYQETDRRKALMEVQALAALGNHENIVAYYNSWFENEQLYIQMELCGHSLAIRKSTPLLMEGEVLRVMHQIAKALQFIHERGIAHLDVKPDNIYVKTGVYKLGDFGCATLLNRSLPIEEGDARYMPQEILNDNYDNLDKVDVFSLGVSIYELIRGSPLPESGSQFFNIREGKLPLLPSYSLQFQNLLKVMVDPDPIRRPSAKEIVENPVFDQVSRNARTK
ncbi:wee1-like protein kinase [Malania oleifera]|uniref:wee1-like protein kinase n=1 Tax=Malania oleifera TaxID=397392 RepID=UPI0025ADB94D|nr:wee1-like protein kinase [Malania oleifera]